MDEVTPVEMVVVDVVVLPMSRRITQHGRPRFVVVE